MSAASGLRVLYGSRPPADLRAGTQAPLHVALGNFDGVHLGHQALLAQVRARAAASRGLAGVLTFEPHPAQVLAPALAPPLLLPLERRIELFAEAGLDFVVVEPFDEAMAAMAAEDFVKTVLHRNLDARGIVVGYDFHFGRGRRGDTRLLTELGTALGMNVDVILPVTVNGLVASSTKIREFVLEGRVEGAQLLLGRPFEVSGVVIAGKKRGRTLGFPTANLRLTSELAPRSGVYAALARVLPDGPSGTREPPGRDLLPAAVNIGTNPTFTEPETGSPPSVEAHLIGYAGELYGRRLRIEFLARLRDERRFADLPQLSTQIAKDVEQARRIAEHALASQRPQSTA